MTQFNIRKFLEDNRERMSLSWVPGVEVPDKLFETERINSSDQGLIGHLNLIHPNWVQVVSDTELDYLQSQPPAALEHALSTLERADTLCIAVSGERELPQPLIDFANRTGTPLFRSSLPSVRLMWLMRHHIAKVLAESTTLHGVFLDVLGVGVLITGDSGVGKSELGLELISRGNGLVADDITEVYRVSPETLEGRCPELLRDFLEVRGLGVLNIRTMFGETAMRRKKGLKLIVNLHRPPGGDTSQIERLPINDSYQEILGIKIRTVNIPVVAGRNLAVLVEAAARNFVLQQRGIDTMQEFIARHDRHLQDQ